MTDFVIIALLCVTAALGALCAALIIKNGAKDKTEGRLFDQKLDMRADETRRSLREISDRIQNMSDKNYEQLIAINKSVTDSVNSMREGNEKKLEEMRKTVDEKLTETLNQRLSSSFKAVSDRLENVYRSLGEMKSLSEGVNGLNRVLTNVKARGTWAEAQLGNILDETVAGMYETNVQTNPKYNGAVEFAVKIPSQDGEGVTYLPIDSKFPMEDYARLTAAADRGDAQGLEAAKKALERRVLDEGKLIKQYISQPETTPFAIMYLATEGLYAEIASGRNGVAERLQKDGIMIAGPATITALLSALAMGFRTVAINKKADEVRRLLAAAKAQYAKFGEVLEKARKKVDEAGRTLDDACRRNDIIQKNLKNVESIDAAAADGILDMPEQ